MPEVTPELLILLSFIEARRLQLNDPSKCRKHFVGRARRMLGRALPVNVLEIAAARSEDAAQIIKAQRPAQLALAALCRRCGGCDMAEE